MKKIVSVFLIFAVAINIFMADGVTGRAEEKKGDSVPLGGTAVSVYDSSAFSGIQKRAASARLREVEESLGGVLNTLMNNYLTGEGTEAAEVITISELSQLVASLNESGEGFSEEELANYEEMGLKSVVSFPLHSYQYSFNADTNQKLLQYLYQAIGEYPNLSALYTQIMCFYGGTSTNNYSISQLFVFSPLEEDEFAEKIAAYKEKLEQLEEVPSTDCTMTTAEKLLYLHDKIVTMGEYAPSSRVNLAINHTPLGITLNGEGVCQSYAAVMNQAAMDLGILSLQVCSDEHAWNAVQIKDKWYYIDTTYDDPVFQNTAQKPENYVNHKYFLFHQDSYPDESSHKMNAKNIEYYGYILDSMGSEYEDYFPKKNDIKTQMTYENSVWVYMVDGVQQIWEGETPEPEDEPTPTPVITTTPAPVTTDTPAASPTVVPSAAPLPDPTETPAVVQTQTPPESTAGIPTIAPAQLPAVTSSGNSSAAAPGKTVIRSLKNKKSKSIQCKLKKVKKAAGYQIRYATNKKFKKSKTKLSKSVSVNLKKLKKKKTYYVKARAYRIVNGKKKYGKWSSVKKCKVKR